MSSTLYIDGLLASVGEQELTGMFSTFGNVLSVDVYQPDRAFSSGIGAVEMANLEEATKAISAASILLEGNLLLVFHAPHARKTSGDPPGMVGAGDTFSLGDNVTQSDLSQASGWHS